MHGRDDVVTGGWGDKVVEVQPGPARFDALATVRDFPLEGMGPIEVDAEQAVPVWSRARTAASRLDAEQVIEQRHDIVVMQVTGPVAQDEGNNGQPGRVRVTKDADLRVGSPGGQRLSPEPRFPCSDQIGTNGLLQLEDQPRADGTDDVGGAGFLPGHRVGEVLLLSRIDVGDGAPAWNRRYAVVHQRSTHGQETR